MLSLEKLINHWLFNQICKASNQYGEQKLEIVVQVNSYLSVHMNPQIQIINSGGTAIFNCTIAGTPTNIEWFHNGKSIVKDEILGSNKWVSLKLIIN